MKILKSKKLLFLAGGILIIGSLTYIFYPKHTVMPTIEAVSVDITPVKVGDVPIQAQAIGTLAAAKSVQISPEISGQISGILFKDGTYVTQGTPLIQLDDRVDRAKLDSAKAALFYSETNYKRMTLLRKKGAVAQQAVDQALADLTEKKANAAEAEVAVEKKLLKAPFDGTVGKSSVNPGDYVAIGQALVNLIDTKHLRVEYSVPEKFLPSLKLNQDVTLTSNTFPGKIFYGKVSYISPTINSDNRTITLYAAVPNDDSTLTAGLFVTITQSLGIQHDVIMVPAASLVATIDGQMIYKVVNGKAVSASVLTGERTTDFVQVIRGLNRDDKIVIAGQQKLKDGAAIKPFQELGKKAS